MSLIAAMLVAAALAQEPGSQVLLSGSGGLATAGVEGGGVDASSWFQDAAWTVDDDFLLTALGGELAAVRPLAMAFDGELEIMGRLQAALDPVTALSTEDDLDMVYRALVFQGFAVHRYFQDQLSEDPAAAPYRTLVLDQAAVAPWAAAIALAPDRSPDLEDLPEEPQRLAFDALRAQLRLAPVAKVSVVGLAPEALVRVDGVAHPAGDSELRLVPGPHWLSVWVDGVQVLRTRIAAEPGETVTVAGPWGKRELAALRSELLAGGDAVALPPAFLARLEPLEPPVVLTVPDGPGGPRAWKVVGGAAIPHAVEADSGDGPSWLQPSKGVGARVSLGGGWLFDGDYYLLHAAEGAPATRATVNSVPFTAGVSANAWSGLLAVGAGVDLLLPFGEHQTLPSGEKDVRARLYPHVSAGAIFFQVTAGWLFPWQLGLGAVAHVPLGERLSVSLHGLYGKGWTLDRSPDPDFDASDSLSAWVTLDVRGERSPAR